VKHVTEKEGRKGREDEKEDVSIYWIALRKREGTGNWKRYQYIARCGERTVEVCGPVVRQMLPTAADDDDVSLCEIFIAPKGSTLIVSEQDYALMGGDIMSTKV
jgi:hypothetical protein